MTVREVAETLGLTVRTPEPALDTEVTGGVVCDLLSIVMSHGSKGLTTKASSFEVAGRLYSMMAR